MKLETGKYYRFDLDPIRRLLKAFGNIIHGGHRVRDPIHVILKSSTGFFHLDGISNDGIFYYFNEVSKHQNTPEKQWTWYIVKYRYKVPIDLFDEYLSIGLFTDCISEVPETEMAKFLLNS